MLPSPANATSLRITDHRKLMRLLRGLDHTDADKRAMAALEVSLMLKSKGLSWPALIPHAAGDGADAASLPPGDWRSKAMLLLDHGELDKADHAAVKRVAAWKTPGVEGMERLREISRRCGMEALFLN